MYSMRFAASLVVVTLAVGCSDPAEVPGARSPAAVKPSPHEVVKTSGQPKFWLDDIAAEMIRTQLDLDQTSTVLVARWENGTVDGWADFVPKEETQRISLKTLDIAPPEGTHAIWTTGPEKISGWLVIVLQRDATAAENLYQCRLKGQYTCHVGRGSQTFGFVDARGTAHWGRVKDSPTNDTSYSQFVNGHDLEMVNQVAGERMAWLELTFKPASIKDRQQQ